MSLPDQTAAITFTVTGGVASVPVISGGSVPPGTYIIRIGLRSVSNSLYLAVVTPTGTAENSNFAAPFAGL
jgi:hypothetical protein